ncbi:MAG: DNA polymerase III subunit delta', partial [Candidatus Cloacimonadaceae bacterium]|nr:DNA polymerase III subunit delta' [Candidatus Cloacimonadaceae bacterium]
MFRQIIGQDHALGLFKSAMANDRVAQAYLFHGNDGVGKFITALYFGMALNCFSAGEFRPCGVCTSCRKFLNLDHPDFIYIFPTPNMKMSTSGEIKDAQAYKEYESFIENKKNTPWKDFFFSSSAEIRKESIMMLQQRLELSISEASYRICIIEDADKM